MKKKRLLFLILFLLILIPLVYAEQNMKLLAVEESALGSKGTIADLNLKTVKGKGEVYTATFPLTEMDTQISTRIAKDIACEYVGVKCNDMDFLYTIKSDSSIVGGPSGGAALAVLTVAELKNKKIDEKVSITGTINSGGLIGPVGGIEPKIKAASFAGLDTVLIPKGTRYLETVNESNETITTDLVELGNDFNVTVAEVSTIGEAYSYFVHTKYVEEEIEFEVNDYYKNTMQELAKQLCERTEELKVEGDDNLTKEAENFTQKAEKSFEQGKFYSSASYCFGANIKYQQSRFEQLGNAEAKQDIEKLYSRIKNFKTKDYDSITDLQIYMVVKERLYEAERWLDLANESMESDDFQKAKRHLAFANERVYSAEVWSSFFNNNDEKIFISQDMLKQGCLKKVEEAKERIQYVRIYFPDLVKDTQQELMQAELDYEIGQYELCMFKAAKAKAEADSILSIMGVKKEYLDSTIDEKLKVVVRQIAKRVSFPIVAYSYYEYANDLKSEDKYSSILYAEYAMELSNLEMYYNIDNKKLELPAREKLIILFLIILLILISHYHIRHS
jgi:uncharacterized protein